jgi:hypothetical protein
MSPGEGTRHGHNTSAFTGAVSEGLSDVSSVALQIPPLKPSTASDYLGSIVFQSPICFFVSSCIMLRSQTPILYLLRSHQSRGRQEDMAFLHNELTRILDRRRVLMTSCRSGVTHLVLARQECSLGTVEQCSVGVANYNANDIKQMTVARRTAASPRPTTSGRQRKHVPDALTRQRRRRATAAARVARPTLAAHGGQKSSIALSEC